MSDGNTEGFCYFITNDHGHIKIGSSKSPKRRLRSLQTGNPRKLRLLAQVPGGRAAEAHAHTLACQHRGVGEWFAMSNEDAARIVEQTKGKFAKSGRVRARRREKVAACPCVPDESGQVTDFLKRLLLDENIFWGTPSSPHHMEIADERMAWSMMQNVDISSISGAMLYACRVSESEIHLLGREADLYTCLIEKCKINEVSKSRLVYCALRRVDFTHQCSRLNAFGSIFSDCVWPAGVAFQGVMDESTFTECTMSNARMENARLYDATFRNARLAGAKFGWQVDGARFLSCDMSEACFDMRNKVPYTMQTEVTAAMWNRSPKMPGEVTFTNCDLRGASFCYDRRIEGAPILKFTNCDLRHANTDSLRAVYHDCNR